MEQDHPHKKSDTEATPHEGGSEETVLVAVQVTVDLKRNFHSACVQKGTNMRKVLVDFMLEYIKTNALAVALLLFILSPLHAQDKDITMDELTSPSAPTNAPAATPPHDLSPAPSVQSSRPAEVNLPPASVPAQPKPSKPLTDDDGPVPAPGVIASETVSLTPPADNPTTTQRPQADQPAPAPTTVEETRHPSKTLEVYKGSLADMPLEKTDRVKTITLKLSSGATVQAEVPIFVYLKKIEPPKPPAPPAPIIQVGIASDDLTHLKSIYNALLAKAANNPSTASRFKDTLVELHDLIDQLDASSHSNPNQSASDNQLIPDATH